jgi:hypothetical protein
MPLILLVLDFLIPATVFFLGRAIREKEGVSLKKEALLVLILAIFFAPILYACFPISVQGIFTAALLFLQSILAFKVLATAQKSKE